MYFWRGESSVRMAWSTCFRNSVDMSESILIPSAHSTAGAMGSMVAKLLQFPKRRPSWRGESGRAC
jgi:hypothetical protein